MANFLVGLFTGFAVVAFAWWRNLTWKCEHCYTLLSVDVGAESMAYRYRCVECGELARFCYEESEAERLVKG